MARGGPKAALEHKVNSYNAVEVVDPRSHAGYKGLEEGEAAQLTPTDPREFERDLWQSLQCWRKEGRKGVWLRIGIGASDLIPVAVQAGFVFHHAEDSYVMLSAWLAAEHENKLPPGPSHFIGVAGFVVNSKNEVLCIREKSGPSARLKDFWKLPGGLVDQQEDLRDAVVREVLEETGLRTRFKQMASIQEIHHVGQRAGPAREGTTDLYCICVLEAEDETQTLVPQEEEIAACQWVPVDTLLNSRYYSREGTVFATMFRAAAKVASGNASGLESEHLQFGLAPGSNTVYAADFGSIKSRKSKL
ncbi:Nucleoside diphosphate-linked moiety X motif 6 [Hondaea fermentalgiana]|uniref:Nucleoside diphosphate-linked moiety X motif 6 n=1 Tax=Hondaea fermentalgiana TaxID=2315210 RepID=A0A2R5GJ52_9STRA|nr:Nucleoside diphosphate-linked moiety X motif 6 [Hondaea fermentalgiana]|eukprot:GBG29758.1 Nucleoside diphosphate-linked moiety X motif 6 [Hondaea fermentalgiana]